MSEAFFLTTLGRIAELSPYAPTRGLVSGEQIVRHVPRRERRLMGRASRRARIKAKRAAWKAAHAARFAQVSA